jgi:hypothetical protein
VGSAVIQVPGSTTLSHLHTLVVLVPYFLILMCAHTSSLQSTPSTPHTQRKCLAWIQEEYAQLSLEGRKWVERGTMGSGLAEMLEAGAGLAGRSRL